VGGASANSVPERERELAEPPPTPRPRERASLASDPAASRGEGRRGLRRSTAKRIRARQLRHLGDDPGARSGAGKTARLHHRGGRRRGDGAAAAQQDGGARRRRHRGRAGHPDPRRTARVQGRGRKDENLDAASPAAPGKIRRRASRSSSSPNTSRRATSPPRSPKLVEGIRRNDRTQVLLGVTGSGKTYTMAKVIEATQRPALILAPNKTLAAQLYGEFKSFFSRQRGGVFCQLLRLLPARGLCAAHRHLYRERLFHQRADRPHASLGDAGAAGARRRSSSWPRCRASTVSARSRPIPR